jgi:ubiquinone/menaquinone biosynthesis C-methylase UbiE
VEKNMTLIAVNTTYEPFSKEPEYIQANREFINNFDFKSVKLLLDLACGIGTMTDLVLEAYPRIETVVGVDISQESLFLAKDHFNEKGLWKGHEDSDGIPEIILAQASADLLPIKSESFDALIMGNSIHLLPDEHKLLKEVSRVLRPGAVFAFNSSFYAGTMPKESEKFHHEWVKQALAYVNLKDGESRKQGLGGIPRKRGTVRRAFTKRWLSLAEWTDLLQRHGFEPHHVNERTVFLNQRCFEAIGAYAGLASVLLSGYPVNLASEALQMTVGPSLSEVNMEVVPRYWLEVVAIKK